jgi:geranylgeranyl diphosphate synthase type II
MTIEAAMDISSRIETALDLAVSHAESPHGPPLLTEAIRYAVFPGGHRIRPRLSLAVAIACGDRHPEAADAAATAIELLHCASLVHDDLPCFDNASLRRGRPSVHAAFGAPLAVLAGDALIVLAFETLARGTMTCAHVLPILMTTIGRSVGSPHGIVAGQAWECEKTVALTEYQRAKTGALFIAATAAGAAASGQDPDPWRHLGERLGLAYQVADDLRDVLCDEAELGKPIGQDAALHRPNAAAQLGIVGAKRHLEDLVQSAVSSIPDCPGAPALRDLIKAQTKLFFPKQLALVAA